MPINAFGGGPGSGKTYGVMEHVILPAIAKGRFVLTNIEGLNTDLIYEYVAKEFYKGKIFCIGHIRRCDRSAPDKDEFFPGEEILDKPVPVPSPDAPNVVGGDLVVVDEATRYWSVGEKVKRSHAYFFREHRHFSNEMGHTCDLVVIDPDLTMLARALKGKVELASVTHKPKEIGLDRYVVRLYRGVRLTKTPTNTMGPYKFREEIYSLYKSYSHEGAKEQAIDGRQNVFNNPRFWAFAVGILLMFVVCIWGLYSLYQKRVSGLKDKNHEAGVSANHVGVSGGRVGSSVPGRVDGVGASAIPGPVMSRSAELRVAGQVVLNGQTWVVVSDGAILRLENPQAFVGRGSMIVGDVDGQRVTTWSGPARQSSDAPVPVVGGGK